MYSSTVALDHGIHGHCCSTLQRWTTLWNDLFLSSPTPLSGARFERLNASRWPSSREPTDLRAEGLRLAPCRHPARVHAVAAAGVGCVYAHTLEDWCRVRPRPHHRLPGCSRLGGGISRGPGAHPFTPSPSSKLARRPRRSPDYRVVPRLLTTADAPA
jgi:hypothetical protein